MSTFFLRGVFGSGQPPAPVLVDENYAISAAVRDGTTLLKIVYSNVCITLLDKIDNNPIILNGSFNSADIANVLFAGHYLHKSGVSLINAISDFDNRYAGKTYIMHLSQVTNIDTTIASQIANAITNARTNALPAAVLHGVSGNLREMHFTPIDICNASGKSYIFLYSRNDYYGHGVKTVIMGKCIDRRNRSKHIRVWSQPTRKTTEKIEKAMKVFNGNIFVFSINESGSLPRIQPEHINALAGTLMTQEQADIYRADAPDDDAVAYDGGDGDDGDKPDYVD